jgi:hypothetical protein
LQRNCSSQFEADLKNWVSGCRGRQVDLWTWTAALSSGTSAITGTHNSTVVAELCPKKKKNKIQLERNLDMYFQSLAQDVRQ